MTCFEEEVTVSLLMAAKHHYQLQMSHCLTTSLLYVSFCFYPVFVCVSLWFSNGMKTSTHILYFPHLALTRQIKTIFFLFLRKWTTHVNVGGEEKFEFIAFKIKSWDQEWD